MKRKPRLLVFNSGSGSGFQELVENSRTGVLNADIVGLVSNKKEYKCINRAIDLGIFLLYQWVALKQKIIKLW